MNIKRVILFLAVFFLMGELLADEVELNSVGSNKQQPIDSYRNEQSNGWFFSAGHMSLDSDNAAVELIDDSAFYMNVGWEGHKDTFVYATGISLFFLSDNDSFSQVVQSNFGGTSVESSTALGFGIFGEMGYSHVLASGNTAFEILGGAEVVNAERSIPNCSNCYSENINLDSGLYIKPRFRFYNGDTFIFSLAYQHYLSGDIDGGLSLMFSWHY